MSTLSDTFIDGILTDYFKTTPVYLALFKTTPSNGLPGLEVVGGSYARQPITFGPITNGVIVNTTLLIFPTMPAVTVKAGGVYTDVTAGDYLIGGSFSSSRTVAVGRTFRIEPGDLIIRVR